jgi:hypothetical protein
VCQYLETRSTWGARDAQLLTLGINVGFLIALLFAFLNGYLFKGFTVSFIQFPHERPSGESITLQKLYATSNVFNSSVPPSWNKIDPLKALISWVINLTLNQSVEYKVISYSPQYFILFKVSSYYQYRVVVVEWD